MLTCPVAVHLGLWKSPTAPSPSRESICRPCTCPPPPLPALLSGLSRPGLKGGGSPQHRRSRRDRAAGTGLPACGARPDAPCQAPTVPGASPTLTAVLSLSLSFSLTRPHPFSLGPGPVAGSLRGQEGALGRPDPWLSWPPHLTQGQIRSEGLLSPLQPPPPPGPACRPGLYHTHPGSALRRAPHWPFSSTPHPPGVKTCGGQQREIRSRGTLVL